MREPTHFGHYEVIRKLGSGGSGAVYLAHDPRLQRRVAIKTLLVRGAESAWKRLVREARAAGKLRHANLVQVFELEADADPPYMVMEAVEGRTLEEVQGGLPLTRRLELLATVARAVHFAHEQGVLHRDLKPSNVLVEEGTERVVVSDFGLARDVELGGASSVTGTGMAVGTPDYMAPEQATGKQEAQGPATDAWALGVMLYHALSGELPFRAESHVETMMNVVRAQPRPLPGGVASPLAVACRRALSKDPADRPTALALAELLEGVSRGAPAAAPAPRRSERGARPQKASGRVEPVAAPRAPRSGRSGAPLARPEAGLTALLAAAILLAGGAGAVFVWKLRAPRGPSQPPPSIAAVRDPASAPGVTDARPDPAPIPPPHPAPDPGGPRPGTPEPSSPAPSRHGGAELRPRRLPERPRATLPWTFPPRTEWATTQPRLVLRGRGAGAVSVTPAEGPPLGATSGPDGRFALVLPLEEGRNPFRVRVGDGREVELVVRRLRPIEAREFKESYLVERTLAGRVELIRRLDPTRAPQRDLALDFALAKLDADQREAAIEAIASVPFDELEWVEKLAGERGDPPVAEGLVEALGRAGDPRAVPLIAGQLEARKTIVADAAIRALGRIGTAECVAHLTSASLAEVASRNGPRSLRTLHETLRELGQPAPPPADEESLEAFSGGVRLAVRVRGRPDAKGLPIYVFPPPGLSADVMVPYLEPLEADSRLIYVELPGRRALPRDAEVRAGRFYPLERVLEAVEELHVALVETRRISGHRVAMVGCGLSGWIPMLYAAKHPKAARRQVLIGVPSGAKAWREGLASMEAKGKEIGDLEMERVFRAAEVDPLFLERSPDAARKAISLLFADVRDLEIVRLRGPLQEGDRWWIQRPIGELEVPDFSLFRLDRSSTPTLVMVGGMSTRCSLEDAGAIARHYQPAGKVVVYKLCDQVPWIERQEEFLQDLRRFLGVGPR